MSFQSNAFQTNAFQSTSVSVEIASGAFLVQVEFTSGVWTTIGEVASLEIHRGKNHELSRMERGWATLLVRNSNRDYDPDESSSPYAGDVLPMKRIRITSTWDSVTYDNFHGFIRGWPQSWEMGLFQQVLLRADDAFAVLAMAKVAGSRYFSQLYTDTVDDAMIGSLGAAHYWMDEASGATAAVDRSAGASYTLNTVGTNVTFGSPLRPPTYGRPRSVEFGPNNDAGNGLSRSGVGAGPPFASASSNTFWWSCWMRLDSLATDGYLVGITNNTTYTLIWHILGSTAQVTYVNGTFAHDAQVASVFTADGAWHHYGLRCTIDGTADTVTITCYRDGVSIGGDTTPADSGTTAPGQLVGPALLFVGGDGGLGGSHGINGNMAQLLLINDNAPSGAQIIELGTPIWDEFPVEPAGLQIHSLLDGVGWPLADRDIDDGTANMEAYEPQVGDGILDKLLQVAEDSERGLFYAGGDGKLYFKDAATLAALTSVATFGNTGAEVHYETVQTRNDDQDVWNQIEVTAGAHVAYEEDTVSSAMPQDGGYGPRLLRVSTVLDADADADTLAVTLLAQYKDPITRPVQLTLYTDHDTDILEQVFGLELGQRVSVIIRPPAGGDTITLDSQIEGITITATSEDLGVRAVFDLVPFG